MDVLKKVPVREQDPKVRATNFEEVCLGYNEQEAIILSMNPVHCRLSADVYAHRKASVKANVSVVSRENLFPLVSWNVLWLIGQVSMASNRLLQRKRKIKR